MSEAPLTLHGLVAEARTPDDAPAVRYSGLEPGQAELLSYGEMRRIARRVCDVLCLVSSPARSPVALFCEPAVLLPAWVLGVLQAGSAFTPLDPKAPPALLLHILRQSGANLALVERSRMQTFSSIFGEYVDISSLNSGCPIVGVFLLQLHVKQKGNSTQPVSFGPSAAQIDIGAKKGCGKVHQCEEEMGMKDDEGDGNQNDKHLVHDKSDLTSSTGIHEFNKEGSPKYSEEQLPTSLSSDSHEAIESSHSGVLKASTRGALAYVLHTSGTTGVPKIVRVPHCCIVPNIIHLKSLFGVSSQDVVFMAAPLTFDPSIVEMFVALSSGASLIVVHPQVKMNPQRLADVMIKENKVTVLQATPTLMQQFGSQILRSVVLAEDSSLRVLALGGEPFPPLDVLRSWRSLSNGTRIFNLYGVTEVSSWASCWEVPPQVFTDSADVAIHLGSPLLGTNMEVRGLSGEPIVDGEGQLFIGGQQRVCFLGDEVEVAMGTMRPSGDYVHVSGGLKYFFVGRQDGQRKRRGKRLELGSVERAAVGVPGVEASAAVMLEDQRLGLCVVPENRRHREHDGEQSDFLEERIFRHLQELLPRHAVPDFIIFIDRLPATQHGKISMDELVSLCGRVESRGVTRQGRRELQPLLCSSWQKALPGVVPKDAPQPASRFLDCGGDSLRAVQFAADLEVQLEQSFPDVLQLILSNTFDEICRYCQQVLDLKTTDVHGNRGTFESGDQLDGEILKADSSAGSAEAIVQVAAIMEGSSERPFSFEESSEVPGSTVGISKLLDSLEGEIQDVDVPESHKINLQTKRKFKDRNKQGKRQRQEVVNMKHQKDNNIPTDISTEIIVSESMHFVTPTTEAVVAVSRVNRATVIHGVNLETLFHNCEDDLVIATRKLEGSDQKEVQMVDPVEIEMSEVWHFDTNRCVDASPLILVSRGKAVLILGSHSHWLFCLDLHTGQQIWRAKLGGRVESSACVTTSGKHVSVGCYDGGVYVLCLSTGTVCWVFRTGDSVKSSPVLDPVSGWLLVGSHDKHVYALDTQAHRCAWSLPAGSSVFSSPCVGDSPYQAYVGTLSGLLLSLDPVSGRVVWSHDCGKPLFSSPSCALGLVCVGCVDGSLLAVNTSGEELWRFYSSKPFFSSPCLLPDMTSDPNLNLSVLCGCHDGYLYLLSGDGQLLWSRWLGSAVYSSPCARWLGNDAKPTAGQSETLEVVSEATVSTKPMDKKIARGTPTGVTGWRFVTATTEGVVYILDGEGKVLSHYALPGELFSSPILHGDLILVGCRDDNIYCLCSPTLGPSCQEWWTLVDGMFTSVITGPKPHSNSSSSTSR
uniref:beta-alanine-activating enzyme isoform X2 n=1 Tax=Myxine glutinosa TaxID=7769 RepID=UPI00358DE405